MPYNLLNDQGDHLVDMSSTRTVDTLKPMNKAPSVLLKLGRVAIDCARRPRDGPGKGTMGYGRLCDYKLEQPLAAGINVGPRRLWVTSGYGARPRKLCSISRFQQPDRVDMRERERTRNL